MNTPPVVVGLVAVLAVPIAAQESTLTPGEIALFKAAALGELADAKRLVAEGVPVDVVEPEGRTPLMVAAFDGHRHVVSFLLVEGAEVDHRDVNGRTALMCASSGPFVETVELLLDAGAEVNARGRLEGFTALMTAAAEGQLEVVRLLLERGADPSLEDVDGDTALSFAHQNGHTQVADLLEGSPPTN
jgi:ankyrin repeat protein